MASLIDASRFGKTGKEIRRGVVINDDSSHKLQDLPSFRHKDVQCVVR